MLAGQRILIRDTERAELGPIYDMEQGDARNFIIPYSTQRHEIEFKRPDVFYKSVWRDGKFIGFLILVLDPDARSIEFRRIVLTETGRGYGKRVVNMVDAICRQQLGRTRLWLDVFESNARARHVYEQCGYRKFGTSEYQGKVLVLYEKRV